tara:strand:+ start:134 stop:889 length:756 start_codon:yes stop_codon:yes gene_type:complete
MLVSIIIPTFNSEKTLKDNLESIKQQSYTNYEIIIIDNNSNDKTIKIIQENNFKNIKIIVEKDRGIYDAINKGIMNSNGDIISILHSDDFYFDKNVLDKVTNIFSLNEDSNIVYGDLIYVDKENINSILRYWKPGHFKDGAFLKGWHPPHPSFFAKKKLLIENSLYNIEIGNCADVELMHRLLQINKIKSYYLNKTLVSMRYGGKSNKNIKNIIKQNIEIIKFLKIKNNYLKIIIFLWYKLFDRLKQFVIR